MLSTQSEGMPLTHAEPAHHLVRLLGWFGHAVRNSIQPPLTSGPEDFHLRALPEPYVNLSIHTAPIVRPLPWHSDQWARSLGFARRSRSNQSLAPLVRWRIRLNLRRAHLMT